MDYRFYHKKVSLRDGSRLVVRAICPDDKRALAYEFDHLSEQSVYTRFFCSKRGLSEVELVGLTELDFVTHVALVALVQDEGGDLLVGEGRFIVDPHGQSAEVAFVVEDAYQGRGIATHLLQHLAEIGRALGLREFTADVLCENKAMMQVFRKSGLAMRVQTDRELRQVTLSLVTESDGLG